MKESMPGLNGRSWEGTALVIYLLLTVTTLHTRAQTSIDHDSEIASLLVERCRPCHGAKLQMSGLDLRTREGALRGGVHGPAIVPKSPGESRLFRRVAGLEEPRMPLDGALSTDQIELVRLWISAGAVWPDPDDLSGSGEEESSAGEGPWWAFVAPVRPDLPLVSEARWNRNPIDAFVFSKLQEQGLEPGPRADRATLIRRAYLDLVGLLPPPSEVTAFVEDDSENAFARLVDRLLESPHYGECWGRHWLDVARYGDSGGYEHDFDYPNAWRYRDYVVRSFNQDKPYDEFIREQLAGDELDTVTYDTLIATGFNRVLATVGYREKDNPQYRYTYLDNMIATTSRAFMALSVECARCHDHKFDPISQMDYYRMMAVFFPFVNYDYPLVSAHELETYKRQKEELEAKIRPYRARIREIRQPYLDLAFQQQLHTFPSDVQAAVRTPEAERTPGQRLLAAQVLSIAGMGGKELVSPKDQAEIEGLEACIRQLDSELPPLPVAMGIRDGDYRFAPDGPGDEPQPGKGNREVYNFKGNFLPLPEEPYVPPRAYFLPTADYQNKGPEVEPGFVQVITRGNPPKEIPPADGRPTSGRRRALAEWIASEDHPLTARVMVNRIWHHHFGRGIVSTPSNFGRMGQPPSHPHLLDWLATEFVRQGWSLKAMHRLIMNSEVYQMSSGYDSPSNRQVDAANVYLWKFPLRRLDAEIIRDAILTASGKLNPAMGGEPFFPPVAKEVRESFGQGRWEMTEEGPEVWRRSLYSYWKRGLRYPFFDVFDLPVSQVSCEKRITTTVPTQALSLLNGRFVSVHSRFFALRILREADRSPASRITRAFMIALGRPPGPAELDENIDFLRRQNAFHAAEGTTSDPELEALIDLCHVILNLNEFVYRN